MVTLWLCKLTWFDRCQMGKLENNVCWKSLDLYLISQYLELMNHLESSKQYQVICVSSLKTKIRIFIISLAFHFPSTLATDVPLCGLAMAGRTVEPLL